jgi:hypothetical protein
MISSISACAPSPFSDSRSNDGKALQFPPPNAGRRQKSLWFQQGKYFYRARNALVQEALTTEATGRKEDAMRKLAFAAAAAAALVVAVPASAQVYLGADPGGAGVQVGPFGFGVGPRYGYRDYGPEYYAYGSADCRVVKERIHTPSGQIVIKTRRVCY